MSTTYAARWLFPVSGPPLADGTITVRGPLIESIDPAGVRTPDTHFGNVALIPGLVNPHTHLDLSGARNLIPPTDPARFTDWLRGVIAYRRTRTPADTQADVRAGLAECLRFGTTLVGDIASGGASWDALSAADVRAVVFHELIGLSEERANAAQLAADEWAASRPDSPTCVRGVSPHAPYSVHRNLMMLAGVPGNRVAIHLGESPAEIELVRSRSGPLVEMLASLGVWEPSGLVTRLNEPSYCYPLTHRALFVHCNYEPEELFWACVPTYSVVYCPRTHAAFGHPPHPFRDYQSWGMRVALGTDSLASNPDLDPLAEARFVRRHRPDAPADSLLRMVTLDAAAALGWADECGSLDAGKSADFVLVPLADTDAAPHELLLGEHAIDGPRRTLFRGEWRVS